MTDPYFPVHAHSEYSALDGMGSVIDMVTTVESLGQPALALTDHGNMAGALRLYKECRKQGITPFPGEEFYLVASATQPSSLDGGPDPRKQRFHIGLLALNVDGFRALLKLSSRSHLRERFHQKPLIDLADLAALGQAHGNDVAVTSGCYFGWVVQNMLLVDDMQQRVTRAVALLSAITNMGFKHLFVELQNHNIVHDDGDTDISIASALHIAAAHLGLPCVIGQDSHYCDHADQPAHDTMKSIAYHGGNGEDSKFPGDGFHLADTGWLRSHWPDHIWNDAMDGHDALLDLNTLRIPELDSYKFCVPSVVRQPQAELAMQVDTAFAKHDQWGNPDYANRLTEELAVIEAKDMAGYFLLVADYMQWCRAEGIFVNARGSANGSLVCYLLGITNVDPMEWGTDFDRFLSLDRAKPPDIDMDIESDRREDVIGYLKSRYPSMVQLGTWLRMGSSSDEEEKGSVFVQWHAANRRRDGYTGHIPEEEVLRLRLLDDLDVRKGHGAHAGGFVIPGDGLAIEDFLATMLIPSSNLTVTQAPMDDVEEAGFTKLDLLGLRSLTTMRKVMALIGKDPIVDGMGWIPNDDPTACAILRSGNVDNGIFQFEGFSTAKGARKMGVRSTADAIIALALFRPAMMHSGMTDRYLDARKAKHRVRIHPTVDDLFDTTLGVPVFQEDVLGLMKRAGLDADDRNALLKAVKASNDRIAAAEATFERIGRTFIGRATAVLGVSVKDAEIMWQTVLDFSDYGFNRAHATAYGLMGYRMAYLKAHYPLEFMCALLDTWAGTEKEPKYISEARNMGIVIRKPDVNGSSVSWTIDGTALRKGLLTIKGVGVNAATAIVDNAPYIDLDDLCARVPARAVTGAKAYQKEHIFKGTLEKLRDAAALRSLGVDA